MSESLRESSPLTDKKVQKKNKLILDTPPGTPNTGDVPRTSLSSIYPILSQFAISCSFPKSAFDNLAHRLTHLNLSITLCFYIFVYIYLSERFARSAPIS